MHASLEQEVAACGFIAVCLVGLYGYFLYRWLKKQ
jgi:hypothetical protein